MASIPEGSQILSLEESLTYFTQWTPTDRATARQWIEQTEVSSFYVPPSGGYVAGHGGPNRSIYSLIPVNGLVMHVGFLHAWPNKADFGEDVRIELSHTRKTTATSGWLRVQASDVPTRTCPGCFLVVPESVDECDACGHDFAAARAASIERWRENRRRHSEEPQ